MQALLQKKIQEAGRGGAHLRLGARPSHIERRRVAPESKYLGFIPKVGLRDLAEIPRPAFAQGYCGQARLGMTVTQPDFQFGCTESQMRPAWSPPSPDMGWGMGCKRKGETSGWAIRRRWRRTRGSRTPTTTPTRAGWRSSCSSACSPRAMSTRGRSAPLMGAPFTHSVFYSCKIYLF